MSLRRTWSLLAVLALVSPLAAFAVPACGPSQHCPMAGAAGDGPPCHGATIQAEDCCLAAANPAAIEAVPVIALADTVAVDTSPAPRLEPNDGLLQPAPPGAPPAPLYRLFRTLLI